MFDSSQYSRIRLPRSPSEMRLAEEEADQISLFNSRTPSPTCENLANRFDQVEATVFMIRRSFQAPKHPTQNYFSR